CQARSVDRGVVGPPIRQRQTDNASVTNLIEDPREGLFGDAGRVGWRAWANPRVHHPACAGAIVEGPERGSVGAEILHDAAQAVLDLTVDRRFRTGCERLREIRQQGLELQAFREAPLSATTIPTLDEQRHDEPALDEQQADGTDDVA